MESKSRIWPLIGSVQHYAWGKPGATSAVASLHHSALLDSSAPDAAKPYAARYWATELWWGTHPSGEASVQLSDKNTEKLSAHIARVSPQTVLGPYATSHWASDFPFLLKVLSINKALSIQAHPDKALAERLNARSPSVYTDPNHKPEIAIALTPFEAMSGFRASSEIVQNLTEFPELKAVSEAASTQFIAAVAASPNGDHKEALKAVFHSLMTVDAQIASTQLNLLLKRIESCTHTLSLKIKQIHSDYPGDPGVFCLLLLNIVTLQPGEALYMGPNDPHAYFKGDCVECMATSDNVVRAGLTPKFKDVDTLVSMLTYKQGPPHLFPCKKDSGESIYAPPTPEFEIKRFAVKAGQAEDTAAHEGPSIALVIHGAGQIGGDQAYTKGSTFLIYANTPVQFLASEDSLIFVATTSTVYRI